MDGEGWPGGERVFLLSTVSHEQVEPKAQVDVLLSIRYRLPEENGAIIIDVNSCLHCISE